MKILVTLCFVLSLFLISCNSNSSKQTLSSENISDDVTKENNETNDFVELNHPKKNAATVYEKKAPQSTTLDNDTTVYEMPATTAALESAVDYFRANNRYKDWDKKNKKTVLIKGITEKNGSISNVKIFRDGSGIHELDSEAIRLIKQAKLTPARNEKNEIVRSFWMIAIHFPAE
ncbi:hypothetical protein CLV62_14219 [Dysgonomonas alginatilytica]|uniref:TonB-like protein n=1 Tax=Dysgonomonas alginatilytica TaxID=1605892 RepID=A0A2V3PI42_9BACT|nr:hypothetical protein [Dysgonomonas alginatilytica]PXV58872.1 hypothetical protein CLV62_14219 [Dysgonomonas alginatilytica]